MKGGTENLDLQLYLECNYCNDRKSDKKFKGEKGKSWLHSAVLEMIKQDAKQILKPCGTGSLPTMWPQLHAWS